MNPLSSRKRVSVFEDALDNMTKELNEAREKIRRLSSFHSFNCSRLGPEAGKRISFRLRDVIAFESGVGELNNKVIDYVIVKLKMGDSFVDYQLDVSYPYFHELITGH